MLRESKHPIEEQQAFTHVRFCRSYDAAYNMLLNMLQPSTGDGSLKPRSKRWEEAWILADCMNIKVSEGFKVGLTVAQRTRLITILHQIDM
jgi:hypothetical protein